ncbi:MAG: hypothetical protein KatS3mg095_0592 [Candidatus Parcubacteria bacterium]|nr:MAG: hypothetical protein KatS3mg095_0592 [Candidatus Parcubacteria bacterium]
MKKIRFLINFIYFALILIIIFLTVYFIFKITQELTDLYFKNLEKEPTIDLSTNELNKTLETLKEFNVF